MGAMARPFKCVCDRNPSIRKKIYTIKGLNKCVVALFIFCNLFNIFYYFIMLI